jgi:SET domain-containing protein
MLEKDWVNPKIEIREVAGKGRGMFAAARINNGEKVLMWGGNYVNAVEAEKAKAAGKLVMQWDEDLYSIEDRGEEVGYFINHSCDANTWMADARTLIAKRDIEAGEEATADYALWENGDYVSGWECRCGSPLCRGRVTGQDWKLPNVQERYRGHFSPLINRKINEKKVLK